MFIAAISPAFIGILGCGAVLMILGLANKDRWAKSTFPTGKAKEDIISLSQILAPEVNELLMDITNKE